MKNDRMHHTQKFHPYREGGKCILRVTEKVTEISLFLSIIVNEFSYLPHTNTRSFDSVIH